ncbi:unnamed protein product [Psylliodes chrysocephalus]|uniref:RecA family profile 1 domain-containing protein n=1 Tax=Psylliodes chrysocephalus TaxID=3402493 RepID=A0A9P0D5V6_9CUCU|nr:unnamed protein product [Psylliodes chrysocephala]
MEKLQPLVSAEIYQKLIKSGISTTVDFLITNNFELAKSIGGSTEEIEEMKLKLSKHIHKPNRIIKAIDLEPWPRLSTGCKSIDGILRKGIPVGRITEIFGCSGVGKTQFCLQLALQVQLPIDAGGLEKGAVYICTEDIFPAKRLHQLANLFKIKNNLPGIDFESSVYLKHATDIDELQKCLFSELPILLRRENIGLVIIDSIAGPFRGENTQQYITRSRDLIQIAHKLNDICEEHKLAVVCTNQVAEDIENSKTEPALGIAWSNSINYRCQILRYNDSSVREFEIIFSPDLARKKCIFYITQEGLDCKDLI